MKQKIYADAKDKNVMATLIYTSNGTKFYYDEDLENEVDFEKDGYDLFVKGVVAKNKTAGTFHKPVSMSSDGTITFSE